MASINDYNTVRQHMRHLVEDLVNLGEDASAFPPDTHPKTVLERVCLMVFETEVDLAGELEAPEGGWPLGSSSAEGFELVASRTPQEREAGFEPIMLPFRPYGNAVTKKLRDGLLAVKIRGYPNLDAAPFQYAIFKSDGTRTGNVFTEIRSLKSLEPY
jgi:hypothetical protein